MPRVFRQSHDGTLIPAEDYLEMTNEDGSEHKEEVAPISSKRVLLRREEKKAYDQFMSSDAAKKFINNKEIAEDKRKYRRILLENAAVEELMIVRSKNAELQRDNKPLMPDSAYRLAITSDGVVMSAYRAKQNKEMEIERDKARTAAAMEAMGGRVPDTHSM